MPAYFVAMCEGVTDPEEMDAYRPKARETLAGKDVAMRAYGGRSRVCEGDPMESVVIIEFPTYEQAEAWYDSPEYQEALQHRLRGAKFRTFIAEGL